MGCGVLIHGRAALLGLGVIAASACSHAAPASGGGISCTLAQASGTALDAGACDAVLARVRSALARSPEPVAIIALDLSRRGSAIARIDGRPDIAVDVMDRSLRADDLSRLGDAVAAALRQPTTSADAPQ